MSADNEIRARFLEPPPEQLRLDPAARRRTTRTLGHLARANAEAKPERRRRVILAEAYASSLIENIDADPAVPEGYPGRLAGALEDALAPEAGQDLRDWHARLMRGHPDPKMTPGQYRRINVRVGNWVAPEHNRVEALMGRFLDWMKRERDPLIRAIWGHRQFETIHPFADGNGRTGRLLICQTLGLPVMISRHIWHQRQDYYELLDHGSWGAWSDWMLDRLASAASATAGDLRSLNLDETDDYRAVRRMINAPLRRPADQSDVVAMNRYQAALLPELDT